MNRKFESILAKRLALAINLIGVFIIFKPWKPLVYFIASDIAI